MRPPQTPPPLGELMNRVTPVRMLQALQAARSDSRYLHWEEVIRRTPPAGLTHEEWWLALKLGRGGQFHTIPLLSSQGSHFGFALPDLLSERIHRIDMEGGGRVSLPESLANPEVRDEYYSSSIIEEAITSSQLEGAVTTREVAKEMLHSAREPRDRSERMILNNYLTMARLKDIAKEPLTTEVILELHRLVTYQTLRDPSASGRFRRPDEMTVVADATDQILHRPPAAAELGARVDSLCTFANGGTDEHFVHPVIRSILLHFWLAYDHPFVDGNGRTARALFYWSMLRHGYRLAEFLSISRILLKAPASYYRAFLYSESDEGDVTYFLLHQADVICQSVDEFHRYIALKAARIRETERQIATPDAYNYRQRALLRHALRHPHHRYTIEGHRRSHDVVYQTARADLLDLGKRGLLIQSKSGRTFTFTAAPNLDARLSAEA